MLDGVARRLVDPLLNRVAAAIVSTGLSADAVTFAALLLGLAAAGAIASGHFAAGLLVLLLSRVLDGLDGAVARAGGGGTDRGGYIDIVFDFVFYGAIPLAFAIADPLDNALAAAVLLFAFYVNGASFLAYAAIAAKRGADERPRGPKAIVFTAGLAEGTETIAVFAAMCLAPAWFATLAYGFALLCLVTAMSRMLAAWSRFR